MSNYQFEVTNHLKQVITFEWGDKGVKWLETLSSVVDYYSHQWNITPVGVPSTGAMSCCVFCVDSNGREYVLKIPVEPLDGLIEISTLQKWSDLRVSPEILRYDDSTGVFLMKRIIPGESPEPIHDLNALEKVSILCEKLHNINLKDLNNIEPFETRIKMRLKWAHDRYNVKGKEWLHTTIEPIISHLIQTNNEKILLHGDLQPKNIITNQNSDYLIIDPLTCHGESKTDLIFWICSQHNTQSIETQLSSIYNPDTPDGYRAFQWAVVFSALEMRLTNINYSQRMIDFLQTPTSLKILNNQVPHSINSLISL